MPTTITEHLQHGSATSKELQAATGLTQTAVSRQLRGLRDRIVRLKSGRVPRYALTDNAFGADSKLPLFIVDPQGNNCLVAHIRPLAHGGFLVEPCSDMSSLLLGESGNGLYDDLPYFLDDLRPQGFLGRQIAGKLAENAPDFPADPRRWNVDHVGRYLLSNGDDLPGNFKFGHQEYLRVRRSPEVISYENYPSCADAVIRGVLPGSSAGGEQPKFTAYTADRGHVIVKFYPVGKNVVARRWRDILVVEYHALETIHSFDFPVANTRLLELDDRFFLESQRFDRSGEFGRLSLVSLQAVDAEFVGLGSNWSAVMKALEDLNLVSGQHAYNAKVLWCFGRLINNTDMHLGNLSLAFGGDMFKILPVYDMCSMGFAPKSGEIPPFAFLPPEIGNEVRLSADTLNMVKDMAHTFWKAVEADLRISIEFKKFLHAGNLIEK